MVGPQSEPEKDGRPGGEVHGRLLTESESLTLLTELAPSLRILGAGPAEGSNGLPLDTILSVTFDGPVDPQSLGASSVVLRDEDRGLRPGLERVEVAPGELVFTRGDLSDRRLDVTGFFDDGAVRDLASTEEHGTRYPVDRSDVVQVEGDGTISPRGNWEAGVDRGTGFRTEANVLEIKVRYAWRW